LGNRERKEKREKKEEKEKKKLGELRHFAEPTRPDPGKTTSEVRATTRYQ